MINEEIANNYKDKPVIDGYIAGSASLIVTILWMVYAPFHPLVIFALFLVSLFCFTLSSLWLLSKEKTIKEWFAVHPSRSFFVGSVEIAFILCFFISLNLLR